MIISAS